MSRLLQVSNRLPVTVSWCDDALAVKRAPGGVASGLSAVHRPEHDRWIGWTGHVAEGFDASIAARLDEFGCDPVFLDADEVLGFYDELSNGALWPMLHSRLADLPFELRGWEMYERVNRKYADAVVAAYAPGDLVWVHDYQLALVPALVRERLPGARIGFFLHVPFPPPEVFRAFPWGPQMIDGLLGADVVGFQTKEYAANFRETASATPAAPGTDPHTRTWRLATAEVIVDPIGIDPRAWHDLASSPEVEARAAQIRAEAGGRAILVGVDRLDYTKGIPRRLLALESLFASGELDPDRVLMFQASVPSRENVAAYERLRSQTDELVGRINSRYGSIAAAPVRAAYGSLTMTELCALYRAADVMLVTPLRNGMNLVCKEFVASRYEGGGVLVLSEFAGAAEQLTDAVLVNPYDVQGMGAAILRALSMPEAERRHRMGRLRARVAVHTSADWARTFQQRLASSRDGAYRPGVASLS